MKVQKGILLVLLSIVAFTAKSQHLVGKTKDQVVQEIKTLLPDYVIDNTSVNHTYKYLKYVNKVTEQTLLVFLSETDVCTSTKLMSDYSNLLQVKKDLNAQYKPAGKDTWKYIVGGVKYTVKLKREEWYFTVFTSKDK
jgi:hypothetical protein